MQFSKMKVGQLSSTIIPVIKGYFDEKSCNEYINYKINTQDCRFHASPTIQGNFTKQVHKLLPVRLKQETIPKQNEYSKFQIKRILHHHSVLLNQKKNVYDDDYLHRMFQLLKGKENDYSKKRKAMQCNHNSRGKSRGVCGVDGGMYITSNERNTHHLMTRLSDGQLPLVTVRKDRAREKLIEDDSISQNCEDNRILDSFDSEYCSKIDREKYFSTERVLEKLKRKYQFYNSGNQTAASILNFNLIHDEPFNGDHSIFARKILKKNRKERDDEISNSPYPKFLCPSASAEFLSTNRNRNRNNYLKHVS